MKLWTIYNDYAGMGEGRTIQALITYADNQEEAIDKFSQTFDPFWAKGAEAVEGMVENEVTQYLFSPQCLNSVKDMEGRANINLFAQLHFNFS